MFYGEGNMGLWDLEKKNYSIQSPHFSGSDFTKKKKHFIHGWMHHYYILIWLMLIIAGLDPKTLTYVFLLKGNFYIAYKTKSDTESTQSCFPAVEPYSSHLDNIKFSFHKIKYLFSW